MPKSYIFALSEAQNHLCCYCHHPMLLSHSVKPGQRIPRDLLTKDHYAPRCYDGLTHKDNLVAACAQCNWIRGALDAETFYAVLQNWFRTHSTLRSRWHSISDEEFSAFKKECERIDRIKWSRQIKKCVGALTLHTAIPMPLPPHLIRA